MGIFWCSKSRSWMSCVIGINRRMSNVVPSKLPNVSTRLHISFLRSQHERSKIKLSTRKWARTSPWKIILEKWYRQYTSSLHLCIGSFTISNLTSRPSRPNVHISFVRSQRERCNIKPVNTKTSKNEPLKNSLRKMVRQCTSSLHLCIGSFTIFNSTSSPSRPTVHRNLQHPQTTFPTYMADKLLIENRTIILQN